MLVKYHKGFIMQGESDLEGKDHFFSKKRIERRPIYLSTGVHGICDENEVEEKISEAIAEEMKSKGWGGNFSGWNRLLTVEEAEKAYPDSDLDFSKLNTITTEYVNSWKMERILKELTGEQFAQFCKENGIAETMTLLKNK